MRAAITTWPRPTTAIPRIANPTASETNCRWRAWRFCSRWGSRLIRTMSVETPQGQTAADQQHRRIGRKLPRPNSVRHRHIGERIADNRVYAGALGNQLVQPGHQRAAASKHDLVDLAVRGRGEEKLQRPGN